MNPGFSYDRPKGPCACRPCCDDKYHIHLKLHTYANFIGRTTQNVQADALESDSSSPAYIRNKQALTIQWQQG